MNRYAPEANANDNVVFAMAFKHGLPLKVVRSLRKANPTCAALDAACETEAKKV